MHDYVWFGTNLQAFLFPGFIVTTTKGLIGTCIGLMGLAILYEGMKILQIKLRAMTSRSISNTEGRSSEHSSLLSRMYRRNNEPTANRTLSYWLKWTLEMTHWSMHTTLSYLLMLGVMTFNGYIIIALTIGSGLGYWIFRPKLIQMNMISFNPKAQIIKCDQEYATTTCERRASSVSIVAEQIVAEVDVDIH